MPTVGGQPGQGRRVRGGGRDLVPAEPVHQQHGDPAHPGQPAAQAEQVDRTRHAEHRERAGQHVGEAAAAVTRRDRVERTGSPGRRRATGRSCRSAGEEVQLGGEVPVRRPGRQRPFQLDQGGRLAVGDRGGKQIGEDAYPVDLLHGEPGGGQQRGGAVDVVPAAQGVPRAGVAVAGRRRARRRRRGGRSSPGRARRRPGRRPARWPRRPGAARRPAPTTTGAGSSTTSSTEWQSTRSTLAGSTSPASASPSPCTRAYPVGDPGLGGPTGQRGERVGAGVDHGDPVAGLGQRHGEPAGAAADVEHGEPLAGAPLQLGPRAPTR